jgi:hypothetical protein
LNKEEKDIPHSPSYFSTSSVSKGATSAHWQCFPARRSASPITRRGPAKPYQPLQYPDQPLRGLWQYKPGQTLKNPIVPDKSWKHPSVTYVTRPPHDLGQPRCPRLPLTSGDLSLYPEILRQYVLAQPIKTRTNHEPSLGFCYKCKRL